MVGRCVVPGCDNLGHHLIPRENNRRCLWIKAMKLDGQVIKFKRPLVCALHFKETDYVDAEIDHLDMKKRYLKRHAVPSIFPWNDAPPPKQCTFISQEEMSNSLSDTEFDMENLDTKDPLLKSIDDLECTDLLPKCMDDNNSKQKQAVIPLSPSDYDINYGDFSFIASRVKKTYTIQISMSLQRLAALRALMASQSAPLAAFIVPTADAHNSEYIAPVDARREWLSGFTGSAGTAVVTSSRALVWTDGRYYTQFEKEADMSVWTLMKQSLPDTPSMEKWLSTNLAEGAVVGVDPHTMTREEWTPLQSALSKVNMKIVGVSKNLVDEVRYQLNDPPAPRTHNDIIPLPLKYTGKTAGEKIEDLRKKMVEKKAASLVITALDEVAYTLNLRGSDIDYNPVFFSYLLITPSAVKLFWGDGTLPEDVGSHLRDEGVADFEGLPYNSAVAYLESEAKKLSETGDGQNSVWLSSEASEAIHRAAAGSDVLKKPLTLISEVSPVALAKLVKNEVELEGFRNCHIRDGVAVVRLIRWLHEQVDAGVPTTEIQVADKLLEFRKDEADFMGPSFDTIAGAGENGAIIHYTPSRDGEQRVVRASDMFLLDSGGQYRDGTTDITRTRHMSSPSDEQRDAFTRVLKGQILLGSALFPKGVKGNVLDSFARKALWDVGLDYAHGTGHGVGHFLNVHEGPSGVSWRPYPRDPGLAANQILSNEPGYYKVGAYGIRHEDLVETIDVTKGSDHPRARNLIGDYDGRGVLGFRTITLVPNQRKCIDVSMLDDFELSYINAYHQRVLDTLGPILRARGLTDDYKWLQDECAPMARG